MRRELRKASGLFLTLLALLAQLTVPRAAPPPMLSLANMTVLCLRGGHSGGQPAPVHRMRDCRLCFICHGAAGSGGLLTSAPMVPMSGASQFARAVSLPPIATPPMRAATAAQPRGPPILV